MSRFDDLFWLVEVVDAGTISAAAERHNVTAAAVSKRIRALEARLGAKLFIRSTQRIRITEAGETYYQRGKKLLAEFQALEDGVSSSREHLSGSIRINAPLTFGMQQMVEPVNEFLAKYPGLEIKMELDDGYIDILNSPFDLIIRIGRLADSSVIAQRISTANFVCCASPEYLLSHGTPQIPSDLRTHNCLIYEQASPFSEWEFYTGDETETVSVKGNLVSNNGDYLCRSAVAHQGVIYVPEFVVAERIKTGDLAPVLAGCTTGSVNIYAMYPSREYLPVKIARLIEHLREKLIADAALLEYSAPGNQKAEEKNTN